MLSAALQQNELRSSWKMTSEIYTRDCREAQKCQPCPLRLGQSSTGLLPIEEIPGLVDLGGTQARSDLKAKLDNGTLGPTGPHVIWQNMMDMSAAQKKAPWNQKKLLIPIIVSLLYSMHQLLSAHCLLL